MPTEMEAWLEGFPREEVEAQIQSLERELHRLRNALAMYNALAGRDGIRDLPEGEVPTKPQAIIAILRENENRPMKPGEIRTAMIERGWLADTPKKSKGFYATMSRMTAEERITRLADGRYVLPPTAAQEGPMA